jgi:hypothetical protein
MPWVRRSDHVGNPANASIMHNGLIEGAGKSCVVAGVSGAQCVLSRRVRVAQLGEDAG